MEVWVWAEDLVEEAPGIEWDRRREPVETQLGVDRIGWNLSQQAVGLAFEGEVGAPELELGLGPDVALEPDVELEPEVAQVLVEVQEQVLAQVQVVCLLYNCWSKKCVCSVFCKVIISEIYVSCAEDFLHRKCTKLHALRKS